MTAPGSQQFVYARSLVAAAGSDAPTVVKQLRSFLEFGQQNPEQWAALTNPKITAQQKKAVIAKIFDQEILARNFLSVLIDHQRLNQLEVMVLAAEMEVEKISQIAEVDVTSAIELNKSAKDALLKKITAAFKQEVVLNFQVNPDLIGGLIIQYGDAVIDESIQGRLENLRQSLLKPRSIQKAKEE